MTVEFRLLGDVEARLDGRRLEIGHARQRCVLAALLVDVNRPVPVDQLADRVWADQPPHRARNAVAGYLSRLRTLLADAEDVVIAREPGGYVLTTDALSVDLHRFRHLASQARATADPRRTTHRAARGARRGTAHPSARRTPGRAADAAQYRSGRQADALDTYRQMRERLVDELGVDPSPPLRRVHQQILDGEPPPRVSEPAVLAVGQQPSGLPRRATSFIGREHEVLRVAAALREGPLVTLTGVGGVGKTRLALEAAAREQDRFGDGVCVCELAPLDDGAAVTHAVASALRLQQQQGLGFEATVIEYLRTRQLLLVVDNCEHVLEAAARLLDQIVRHCPRVSVLATSREALGIEGERILLVPPLPVEDATRLFADRARAGRPDFDLAHEPAGAVAEICRRLDGLPLAIELAAARMRVMSSIDIARRLDRLRLLSGGARGAPPRQQSLAATIDWSYRLLAEPEQSLFMRLSVFAGGFDLEAAHGVCGADGASEDDTFELLTGLVDKSMVIVRSGADRTRYGVQETLRAFGRDRLRDNRIDVRYAARQAQYYTELAERAAAAMHGADERAWVERMLPEYDNLRAAFERAMADRDIDLALRLVTSLPELAYLRVGYESAGWAERVVDLASPDHPLFAAAVGVAARVAWNRGEFSRGRSLAALAQGRVPGRGTGRVAYPADVLADVALYEGDPHAALAHYDGEVARARRDADPIRLVWTLFYVAVCHAVRRTPARRSGRCAGGGGGRGDDG